MQQPSELERAVAKQAKKGKKRYFIERDLIQKGYNEEEIKQALDYAAEQKKAYGQRLLIIGALLTIGSVAFLLIRGGKVIFLDLSIFFSGCFALYDGYFKMRNFNK